MVASKLASKERGRRNRAHTESDLPMSAVHHERRALMRAHAVLRCVAVALEYDGWTSDEPDYAEAIEAARNLISQTTERLESHSDSSAVGSVRSDSEGFDVNRWGSNLLQEVPRIYSAAMASDVGEVEQLALGLSEEDREQLAASLLDSLPGILSEQDDSVVEALRRDAELDAHPERAIASEELDTFIRGQRD
jgi:hypothetical protein